MLALFIFKVKCQVLLKVIELSGWKRALHYGNSGFPPLPPILKYLKELLQIASPCRVKKA